MNMSDMEGVKTKVCSKCKIERPVKEFHKDKSRKDGLYFHCKVCQAKKYKYYYKTNPDKLKKYQKEYRKANPDNIKEYGKEYRKANSDKTKEYNKEYAKANSDKLKEYRKEYAKANSDKIREYRKEYAKANSDKCNAKTAKRNAKKLQATPQELQPEQSSAEFRCQAQ